MKQKSIITIILITVLLHVGTNSLFAANIQPINPDNQSEIGVVGGDTITFSEDTVWANLSARWGVRIIFQDDTKWNNRILLNKVLPVSNDDNASTKTPTDPSHEGWEFLRWERIDSAKGTSNLNGDGSVTNINGPGPIVYQAVYKQTAKDTPNNSVVPKSYKLPKTGVNDLPDNNSNDYVYGQYRISYLPGTTDIVTNMPENKTNLKPGKNNPYTVSNSIPKREGFEFIEWELSWGTMVDYSNTITVSKKAVAAAAGDANTARAYTITLEAKVDINDRNDSELFIENLSVTDTLEDEFVLNGIKAEILNSEGNVVSSNTVSVNGPTVTYNFGNVKNGHTARLILEITAQSDFIGSNGVYTNVGLSSWTYKHTDPEATAAENYSVTCPDKPQVNVPIVFSLNEKGKDNIKPWAETVALDGRNITIPAHNTAKKYDQTNGTFSYEWEILYTLNANLYDTGDWYNIYINQSNKNDPRGYINNSIWIPDPDKIQLQWPDIDFNYGFIVRIPASETVHISNGQPDVSEETLNNMGYINWKPEVTREILNNLGYNWEQVIPPSGRYMAKLHVTFTPDGITGEETFVDEVTAEIVVAKTKDGYLVFALIPIHSSIDIEPDF